MHQRRDKLQGLRVVTTVNSCIVIRLFRFASYGHDSPVLLKIYSCFSMVDSTARALSCTRPRLIVKPTGMENFRVDEEIFQQNRA